MKLHLSPDVGGVQPTGLCSRGHYCPEGSSDPTPQMCASGTYGATTGLTSQAECTSCPAGSYCPEGATGPVPCAAGTFSDRAKTEAAGPGGFPMCQPCLSGFYCPAGSQTMLVCSTGNYSSPQASSCPNCPPGHYCSNTTTSETEMVASTCPAGLYCPAGMPKLIQSLCNCCCRTSSCAQWCLSCMSSGSLLPNSNCSACSMPRYAQLLLI